MVIWRLWAACPSTQKLFTQRRWADEKSLFIRSGKIHSRGEEAVRHRATRLRKSVPGGGGAKRGHGTGRSEKSGIREPHWHPDAWEFDYRINGEARMSVVGPNNEWQNFKVEPGQIVFVPQGYYHYFENVGKEDLRFLIVFNNSTKESNDDIGISVSLGGTPNHVLAATFGVPHSVFEQIPKLHKEVIITSKRKRGR